MYQTYLTKQAQPSQKQTEATQEPMKAKPPVQRTPVSQREPLYTRLWGNQVPPWLRLSAPERTLPDAGRVAPVQRQTNTTGLPDTLKAGVESLSGLSLDDVQVHYHSSKPAEVQALAYTQGTEIHIGPGQEKHLAHEAWHVVQQMEGRVKPTLQLKGRAINDDEALEREADVAGERAAHMYPFVRTVSDQTDIAGTVPLAKGSTRGNDYAGEPLEKDANLIDTRVAAGYFDRESRREPINLLPRQTSNLSVAQLKPQKVSEKQLEVLRGIAAEMRIENPETITFLQDNETSTSRNVYGERTIILATSILEGGGNRLRFVVGHELGHLVSKDLYWMLTYGLGGSLALGFIAWGIGAGIGLGTLGLAALSGTALISSFPYFFVKASQYFEKQADIFATKLPGAAEGGVEHIGEHLEENKNKQRYDLLGFLYTQEGDFILDVFHPPASVRKAYLEKIVEEQAKQRSKKAV